MTRILIVEDDENIAKTIAATVSVAGYEYEICHDGADAVETICRGGWDLVLLDVMLPGMSGFEIMERVRDAGVSVIFLTAMQNLMDKVNGLKLGAEDYIVKPFEALELLARIEVVLRRRGKLSPQITYGDIVVDTAKHTVEQSGVPVALTPKEFDVLVYFLRNQDAAIPRERLLATVWGYEFVGESRTVDIHVQQIRKKLRLHADLITIPKLGYRLERR